MAQNLANKKQGFLNRYIAAATALLAARDQLVSLASEWTAEGYSGGIVQADIDAMGGALQHLTPAILGNGMTEQGNLETFLASAGRLTNWNALRG